VSAEHGGKLNRPSPSFFRRRRGSGGVATLACTGRAADQLIFNGDLGQRTLTFTPSAIAEGSIEQTSRPCHSVQGPRCSEVLQRGRGPWQ
jgi:hypothetical protein